MYSDNAMLMWHFFHWIIRVPEVAILLISGGMDLAICLLDLQASLKCVEETEEAATVCVEGH